MNEPRGLRPLIDAIRSRRVRAPGVLVMAVDGRSGSGKSTLASALAARLEAAVIEGDDFYAGGTQVLDDPPSARVARCIDWRRQRAVLTALRAGRVAQYRAFDWEAFDGSLCPAPTRVTPAPLVILEGVYSARPELSDLVDLRVLVVIDDATRRQRLQAREGGIGRWEQQWLDAEPHYFASLGEAGFDAVVEGRGADGAPAPVPFGPAARR